MSVKVFGKRLIAHRGFHGENIAENSMGAFEAAVRNGYHIELDVHLSADNRVVVHHDFSLERLTGQNLAVGELTYARIKEIPFLKGGFAPLLTDVFELAQGNAALLIELKKRNDDKPGALESEVLRLLKSYKGDFAVQSFNPFTVDYFRECAPEFVRGLLTDCRDINDYRGEHCQLVKEMLSESAKRVDFAAFNPVSRTALQNIPASIGKICWTIRSQAALDEVLTFADSAIFEGFTPQI